MYNISACMIQKKAHGHWEPGIIIDNGEVILDMNNKQPDSVWNYKVVPSVLSIDTAALLKALGTTEKDNE